MPEARIGPNGGLECDRGWALYTGDWRWVNAKRIEAIKKRCTCGYRSIAAGTAADAGT